MDSELILQTLNNACQYDNLNFQIILRESILHIYINRKVDSEIDYTKLIKDISDALIKLDASWQGFWLYSRVMGQIEPDWQTYVELSNNIFDPLIEQTENLIKEAKKSLEDLKYIRDDDVLAVEELDESILEKSSFLLATESIEEIDDSAQEIEDKELDNLFAIEELDESVLDDDSGFVAEDYTNDTDNPDRTTEENDSLKSEELDDTILNQNTFFVIDEVDHNIEEEKKENHDDIFAVEELDESILDKDSYLLAQESAEDIDDSQGEILEKELNDLFYLEELDELNLANDDNLLANESTEKIEISPVEIPENESEDLFAIEELDVENKKKPDNSVINNSSKIENIDNFSTEESVFLQYCFISNKRLLDSDLVAPKLNISYLVNSFQDFSLENKKMLLPLLNQYFQEQKVVTEEEKENFSPEIQEWIEKITELSSEDTRKAAIWFSRYCYNPEKTIAEIRKVFTAEALKESSAKLAEKTFFAKDQGQNSKEQSESTTTNDKKNQNNEQLTKSLLSGVNKSNISNQDQTIERETETKQSDNYNMNLIVPIICIMVAFICVALGIFLINSNSVDREEQQSFLLKYYF